MTKVTRTVEEIIERIRIMLAAENHTNIERYKLHDHIKSGLESWLTQSEPTIEELRQARPWKDIDVGEIVRCWTRDNDESTSWLYFTESLSPLGLEFARIVQWLNGDWKFSGISQNGYYAEVRASSREIIYSFDVNLITVHKLHFCKDEATIRRAVQIFTEDKYRQMLGVK